ncbi:adenylyltransferase/cytidyltransferase family protein [Candidatus Gracilibacteria bacterium]|nr:adenylyltransferase/cytidyltransferase family protein [Candidatus Gracilibacteria bacterium]
MSKPQIVMTFGTFDMFHPGHLYYLSEAKKLGEHLITVVARDSTVLEIKGKNPRETEKMRLKKVGECGYVDEVILGSENNHYAVIGDKKPTILCFGYDQRSFNNEKLDAYLEKNHLNPEIITLSAFEPEKWKSSKL